MKKCDSEHINKDVFAVTALFHNGFRARIYTRHGTIDSVLSPLQLIDRSCIRHGSTYRGRVEAVRHLLSIHKKTPVLISMNGLGAFPTMSPTQPDCAWIFDHDYMIEPLGRNVRLTFETGTSIEFNVSAPTLKRQKLRLIQTLHHFRKEREFVH